MNYVIFAIDGTLADCDHRLHHLKKNDWDSFFGEMEHDFIITETADLLFFLSCNNDYEIILCSGRPEKYRDVTEKWLNENFIKYKALYMRPDGDHRADHIVKRELLHRIEDDMDGPPDFVVDDRESVVSNCWLKEGLTVFQVRRPNIKETSVDPKAKLIIMVGPSGAGKSWYLNHLEQPVPPGTPVLPPFLFRNSDIISSDQIREDMLGNMFDQSQNDKVFAYLHDAVALRLRNGMTAVVDATNIRTKDRLAVANLSEGVCPVHYIVIDRPMSAKRRDAGWRKDVPNLLERHENTFKSNLKAILRGDGLPNVTVHNLIVDRDPIYEREQEEYEALKYVRL